VADLARLAVAAFLVGRAEESISTWEQAFRDCESAGQVAEAAHCAFWLGFILLNDGELARGGGWVHRGQRLLDEAQVDCVERGYLRYCASLRSVVDGDVEAAQIGFAAAAREGDRFHNSELTALARVGQGRCLIRSGDPYAGIALLDEAMAAVAPGEVSPAVLGDLYCTVIEGCQEVHDVRRAQEWTQALHRWCEAQPELVLYRGQCLVHRAELMVLSGQWSEATAELGRARARLSRPRNQPALGSAHYVRAELHRLRGEFAEAEDAYLAAASCGRSPQPGLARLWLSQGRTAEAEDALRRALAGAALAVRPGLLGAYVEVTLAVDDLATARRAASELTDAATLANSPYLHAQAAHADGAVLLAGGAAQEALVRLRKAWTGWIELGAPHEAARSRVLIAAALQAQGDSDGAQRERLAARVELDRLGAFAQIADADADDPTPARRGPDGLTAREVEVLRLVATGATNRGIAAQLVISEKTVATHVSSILHKLTLPSRAAATSYAHQHHLV